MWVKTASAVVKSLIYTYSTSLSQKDGRLMLFQTNDIFKNKIIKKNFIDTKSYNA